MGFAIKKGDGSYRAWNRNAKDDFLLAGEVWEELTNPPTITVPTPPAKLTLESLADRLKIKGLLSQKDLDDSKV